MYKNHIAHIKFYILLANIAAVIGIFSENINLGLAAISFTLVALILRLDCSEVEEKIENLSDAVDGRLFNISAAIQELNQQKEN